MCSDCVGKYAHEKMHEKACYVDGTQISRIVSDQLKSNSTGGCRGVYRDKHSGKWRARLGFKRKIYNLGSYVNFDDAVEARKNAEREIYGEFLEHIKES